MRKSGIPSPARSQGAAVTPRRYRLRGPRSVGSPARSDVSGRLTSVIKLDKNPFVMSPMPTRRSVLADTTDIEEPKRRSWWRQLGENSRDLVEVMDNTKVNLDQWYDNVEELIGMEVLSPEKKSYHLDLPESSGSESIHSIVMPQRKLFKQKEYEPQKSKFGEVLGNRETLPKMDKTSGNNDKNINAGTRELFQNRKQRNKPIFPAALLDITLNETIADKTKDFINEPPKNQVRNIFGNRAPTKRRNMFAEFVITESEDEIPDIQPKVFGFSKKTDQKGIGSSTSRGIREPSPASSITTDMEMDDWKQLPSSTMVAEQLEEAALGTPVKRARLSKLSMVKESDAGTSSDATNKTKQLNKSVSSRNKSKNSPIIKDKSLNRSVTNRNAVKNIQSNNITEYNLFETSLNSNNKSKNSNSINRRNSRKTLNSTKNKNQSLEKTNQNVSKSKTIYNKENNDNNLPNLIKVNENNVEIGDYDNEEINFTLEYESDDQHETVTPNANNSKFIKNNTVTLRRDSNKIENIVVSPEELENNMSVKKMNSSSKNTIEQTKESEMTKVNKLVSAENKTNNVTYLSANDDVGKEISDRTKAYTSTHKIAGKSDNIELDEQAENEIEIQVNSVDEQMEVDQINETLNNAPKILAVNSQKQNITQEREDVQQMQKTSHASQEYIVKMQLSQMNNLNVCNNELDGIQQNRDEDVNCKSMENNNKMQCESDENVEPETEAGKDFENSRELINKMVNSKEPQQLNKTKASQHIQMDKSVEHDEHEIDEIDTEEQNEYEELEHSANEVEDRNKSDIGDQSECEINNQNDSEIKVQNDDQNESESEKHIEDENEVAEQDADAVEQQNFTEEQNEVDSEEHNESEAEEKNDNESEEQNEREVEEHNDRDVEEQNESEIEEKNESEVKEQNESEIEEHNESEAEEHNESEAEEQNESEVEEQNESEIEEQNESQVEEQNESEAEEDNESEVEEQNKSEIEEQNESEVEEHNESEVEEQNQSEEEEQENSDPDALENEGEIYSVSKEAVQNESHEESEDIIERTETPNSTGMKLPEAVLHDKSNHGDSFTAHGVHGRNTSIRKSKTMIRPLDITPSFAAPRDSIGFSDGTKNSSAEGSGWDSHRTTRKTLRQTFGKDFTPRKSLRALVLEKSTKRHTAYMDGRAEITSLPQANSTEFPEISNRYDDETVESDHELSRRVRQEKVEKCLEQIKKNNMERWERAGEKVRNMFVGSNKEKRRFKPPPMSGPTTNKQVKSKAKKHSSFMPVSYLPPEILEDMKYKPPKRFQPRNASWITKHLYKFLETKLEPKYDYKSRVRAEKLVETIYNFTKALKRHQVAPPDAVEVLKHEMARLDIVKTHFEFYEFFRDFAPREIRIKVIPDIVNKIPLPKEGIFSDILH